LLRSANKTTMARVTTAAAAAAAAVAATLTLVDAGGAAPTSYHDDQFLYTREIVVETPVDGRGRKVTHVNEYWKSADGSKPSLVKEHGRTWKEAPVDDGSVWPPRRWKTLEALPTDPRGLTAAVLDWFKPGNDQSVADESAYMGLSMLIAQPLPQQGRTAALEAMAAIPDVRVVDGLRAAGRPAIGLTRPPDHPAQGRVVILLDRETYEFLGTRARTTSPSGAAIVQLRTRAEIGVVDRAGTLPQ